MVGFPKYESYKDSGVEWLGEIPSHWQKWKISHLFALGRGRVIDKGQLVEDGKYPVYSSQTKEHGIFGYLDNYDFDGEYITWTTDGANAGTVYYHEGKFNCTNVCGTLKPNKNNFLSKFVAYALNIYTPSFVRHDINPKLMNDVMSKIQIFIPTLKEQNRIVEFLDRKTSEIDQAIAQKQRLIELLQEQKAILINQAVTKGLDPNVPMCDRGIEWLGEIPSHWTIGKLKFFLKSIDYGLSESALSDGDYKYLNMGHIQNKKVLVENPGYLTSITDNLLLETNDILFNRTNSFDLVGKSGIFKGKRTDKVTFASYLVRLRPVKSVVPDWLNYLLNDVSFLSYIRSLALRSLNQANLNPNRLSAVHVPVPPTEEQIKIAGFISNLEKEINKQIAIAQRTIELYEELKKTYISQAVTGKIKV